MKQCRACKEFNVRERNGIAVSKWCTACRKAIDAEKKEKLKAKKLKLKELKTQKALAKKERKLKTKKHLKSKLKALKAKAWKLISERVRRTGSVNGYNECYTCRKILPWKESHCAHYIHGKLDFDDRNLKNCCSYCNTYLSGNLGEYTLRLIEDYGIEFVHKLKEDKNKVYTIEDLEAVIEYEKEQLKMLDLFD